MNIHEYQAKDLLRAYGAPVAEGRVADTPQDAAAHAEAIAPRIEAHERRNHRVDAARRQTLRGCVRGFRNAEAVVRERGVVRQRQEPHGAAASVDDARRIQPRAGATCDPEVRCEVHLAVHREVHRYDTSRRGETQPAQDRGDASLGVAPHVGRQLAPQSSQSPPLVSVFPASLLHVAPREERGGATRLCRHEPLLSTWSNIRGRLRHLRLPARGGPAQCCRRA